MFQDIVLDCLYIKLDDLVSGGMAGKNTTVQDHIFAIFGERDSTFLYEWPSTILLDLQSWKESPRKVQDSAACWEAQSLICVTLIQEWNSIAILHEQNNS